MNQNSKYKVKVEKVEEVVNNAQKLSFMQKLLLFWNKLDKEQLKKIWKLIQDLFRKDRNKLSFKDLVYVLALLYALVMSTAKDVKIDLDNQTKAKVDSISVVSDSLATKIKDVENQIYRFGYIDENGDLVLSPDTTKIK